MSSKGPSTVFNLSTSKIYSFPLAFEMPFNVLPRKKAWKNETKSCKSAPETTHLSWGLRPAAFLFFRPSPCCKASVWDPHRGWGRAGSSDHSCWSHQALTNLFQCFSCLFAFSSTHLWGQRCLPCDCRIWSKRCSCVPTYRFILYHQSPAVFFGVSGKANVAVNLGDKCSRWWLGSLIQPWLSTGIPSFPGPSARLTSIAPITVYFTPVSF